jgi:hypothetical protein
MNVRQSRHRETGNMFVAVLFGTWASGNNRSIFDCYSNIPHPTIGQESMIEKQRAGQHGLAKERSGR